MEHLNKLFEQNSIWVKNKLEEDPQYFINLSRGQRPRYLWVGCSDSRVPAASIMGLDPGDLFIHRNIANLIVHTDLNFLSVLQYAVQVLRVTDIIICGHYGCGGVQAAMGIQPYGLADHWLRNIRDVFIKHKKSLHEIDDLIERADRLAEFSVIQQVHNAAYSNSVQNAWQNEQNLSIHGWIFDIKTGLVTDLKCSIAQSDQIDDIYHLLQG